MVWGPATSPPPPPSPSSTGQPPVRGSTRRAARGSPEGLSEDGGSIIKTFTPRQHEVFMAAWFRCVPSGGKTCALVRSPL